LAVEIAIPNSPKELRNWLEASDVNASAFPKGFISSREALSGKNCAFKCRLIVYISGDSVRNGRNCTLNSGLQLRMNDSVFQIQKSFEMEIFETTSERRKG
jgi:hypothetical protein